MNEYAWLHDERQIENPATLAESRVIRRELKLTMRCAMKKEVAQDILQSLPEPGESYHVIGNGSFDYWSFVPIACQLLGNRDITFYGSTWTANRENVKELMSLFDQGILRSITMLTGLYFKRREASVYATLLEGLRDRGQRYVSAENHAKVTLLHCGPHYLTIEGSANYTANPRIEQYCIINDPALYSFHRAWMEEIVSC